MSGVDLHLDNPSNQFFAGSVITGRAICHFNSNKDVRKVRIRLLGNESTLWMERERYHDPLRKKDEYRQVSYHGDRDFLLRDLIVHGEGTMNSGEHVFPFEFILPENNLPSTFQHNYGRIKYTIIVTVDLPMKTDYERKQEIIIIAPIRLQSISLSLLEPVELSDEKTICCFCCTSGPVQLDVKLQKRAFVVAENAIVNVNCTNMSNTNVERIAAEIKLELTFKATRPFNSYKYDSELVTTAYSRGVGAHGETACDLILEIPSSTVIPNFDGSELFSLDAQLKVTAALSGCHSNLDVKTNVAIGHAPPNPQAYVGNQYQKTAPFYSSNAMAPMSIPPMSMPTMPVPPMSMPSMPVPSMSMPPMSMPMPMPSYEPQPHKYIGMPPYPVEGYSPGPSAPREVGAPSAPPKSGFDGNPANYGVGSPSELPPPSYDEAAKK